MTSLRSTVLAACLALAACASGQTVATPVLPADMYPVFVQPGAAPMTVDEHALYDAGIVLGNNGPRPVNPQQAAHAIASVEYLAGALNSAPYWIGVDALAAATMVQARQETRAVIGARPDADGQSMVNALVAASAAKTPDQMIAALNTPDFPDGGAATYARIKAIDQLPITRHAIPMAATARYYLNSPNDNGPMMIIPP